VKKKKGQVVAQEIGPLVLNAVEKMAQDGEEHKSVAFLEEKLSTPLEPRLIIVPRKSQALPSTSSKLSRKGVAFGA